MVTSLLGNNDVIIASRIRLESINNANRPALFLIMFILSICLSNEPRILLSYTVCGCSCRHGGGILQGQMTSTFTFVGCMIKFRRLPARVFSLGLLFAPGLPFPPEVTVIEHLLALWVNGPVMTFTGVTWGPRDLFEAIVQRQIVTYRVLPACFTLLVEGEVLCNESINAAQRQLPEGRGLDCHGDERWVGIGRAHHPEMEDGINEVTLKKF